MGFIGYTNTEKEREMKQNFNRIAPGYYQTGNREFQIMFNNMTGQWQLLSLDAEGDYQWCQSYALLKDAKMGAAWIVRRRVNSKSTGV